MYRKTNLTSGTCRKLSREYALPENFPAHAGNTQISGMCREFSRHVPDYLINVANFFRHMPETFPVTFLPEKTPACAGKFPGMCQKVMKIVQICRNIELSFRHMPENFPASVLPENFPGVWHAGRFPGTCQIFVYSAGW